MSQTVLTNRGDAPLSLSYYEAWGGQIWQMAYGAAGRRREFQRSQVRKLFSSSSIQREALAHSLQRVGHM